MGARIILIGALFFLSLPAALSLVGEEAERGQQIYREGNSPSGGEVTARIAGTRTELPASAMPCASCHGPEGEGGTGGSLAPSKITWPALSQAVEKGGRKRPAYDEASLARAIEEGLDPAGNELTQAMPRYRMSAEDMEALVAYLQSLGTNR